MLGFDPWGGRASVGGFHSTNYQERVGRLQGLVDNIQQVLQISRIPFASKEQQPIPIPILQSTPLPAVSQIALPPLPNFDNLRQQFAQDRVIPKEQESIELIQAIGRLENVMKTVRSPIVNQANTTNNTFESGAADNGDLARRIEQQQRDIQYRLLKELERRAV